MSSVRAEFEAWRQRRLAELTEERNALTGQREHLDARKRAAIPTGSAGEEVARALEEFLQRNRCAEGTLEMTRIATGETEQFDSIVYGTGVDGQPESFFQFRFEPFATLAEKLLQQHPGNGVLTVRVDLSARSSSVTLMGAAEVKSLRELEKLEGAVRQVDSRLAWFRDVAPSDEPFGPELAWSVVRRLKTGASLGFSHRDYCGMGLYKDADGSFVYASLWDGFGGNEVRRFKDEEHLARWLAQQSDLSLSNYGDDFAFLNQTLNRKRLEEFVTT
ncbi:hypothetical protein [Vitiosangium sp. GDMCC 1.1324]|uniref:hypothetical protein n=1 Tax=Vitiosangium sp. (strain GDMCC 1.1324) TaxID=2138576 RepID=UPI000D36C844|nr:hypothetical protein [Vitiosangium sp. GDMCC 1.1324]PTL77582.1 hypothetical protein DAT35_43035 [Vitiosangium sp. GDMCC 1.1324]